MIELRWHRSPVSELRSRVSRLRRSAGCDGHIVSCNVRGVADRRDRPCGSHMLILSLLRGLSSLVGRLPSLSIRQRGERDTMRLATCPARQIKQIVHYQSAAPKCEKLHGVHVVCEWQVHVVCKWQVVVLQQCPGTSSIVQLRPTNLPLPSLYLKSK